jgi:hypothetical protein
MLHRRNLFTFIHLATAQPTGLVAFSSTSIKPSHAVNLYLRSDVSDEVNSHVAGIHENVFIGHEFDCVQQTDEV